MSPTFSGPHNVTSSHIYCVTASEGLLLGEILQQCQVLFVPNISLADIKTIVDTDSHSLNSALILPSEMNVTFRVQIVSLKSNTLYSYVVCVLWYLVFSSLTLYHLIIPETTLCGWMCHILSFNFSNFTLRHRAPNPCDDPPPPKTVASKVRVWSFSDVSSSTLAADVVSGGCYYCESSWLSVSVLTVFLLSLHQLCLFAETHTHTHTDSRETHKLRPR